MIKRTSPNGYSWVLVDNKRDTFNVTDKGLIPNLSDAEGTGYSMDFFSNGFKLRLTGHSNERHLEQHIFIYVLRNLLSKMQGQGRIIDMAFKLNGNPLAVDVPFTVGDINYPANWLRLSSAQEKKESWYY